MGVHFCQACRSAFAATSSSCPRCGAALPPGTSKVPAPEQEAAGIIAGPGAMIRGSQSEEQLGAGEAIVGPSLPSGPAGPGPVSISSQPGLGPTPLSEDQAETIRESTPRPDPAAASSISFDQRMAAGPDDPTRLAEDVEPPPRRNTLRLEARAQAQAQAQAAGRVAPAGAGSPRSVVQPGSMPAARPYVPFAPKWGRVIVGGALVLIALGLVLGYLPPRSPLSEAEAAVIAADSGKTVDTIRAARLSREIYLAGTFGGWSIFGVGLLLAGLGAFHRPEAETQCRSCGRRVFAVRASLGLRCPACRGYAKLSWFVIVVTASFWLLAAVGCVTLLVVLLA